MRGGSARPAHAVRGGGGFYLKEEEAPQFKKNPQCDRHGHHPSNSKGSSVLISSSHISDVKTDPPELVGRAARGRNWEINASHSQQKRGTPSKCNEPVVLQAVGQDLRAPSHPGTKLGWGGAGRQPLSRQLAVPTRITSANATCRTGAHAGTSPVPSPSTWVRVSTVANTHRLSATAQPQRSPH